jgi:uncharacterized protein
MSQSLPPWTEPPPRMPGAPPTDPSTNGASRPPLPRRPDVDRPVANWRWWEALLVYVGALLVSGFVALPFLQIRPTGTAQMAALSATGVVELSLIVLWLRRFHPGWREVIGIPSRARLLPEAWAGLLRGVVLFIVITYPVGIALTFLFRAVTGHPITAPEQLPANLDGVGRALAVLYAVVVAPVTEETFFRGCLFRALRDRHGFRIGALASAFIFGLVHYVPGPFDESLLLMTAMVFTGVGLAYIYERRGNIVASIGAHMTFNAIAIVLIFLVS